MMKNYGQPIETNHNPYWSDIPSNSCKILIIGGSGSGKTNVMNLTENQQPDIEKNYLFVKDLFESEYQLLVNKRGKVGIKKIKKSKSIY